MKKVINFVCSIAILFVLFCMAYYGLSFAVELPNIDFVNDFAFGVLTEWTFHGGFPFNNLFYFIFFNK